MRCLLVRFKKFSKNVLSFFLFDCIFVPCLSICHLDFLNTPFVKYYRQVGVYIYRQVGRQVQIQIQILYILYIQYYRYIDTYMYVKYYRQIGRQVKQSTLSSLRKYLYFGVSVHHRGLLKYFIVSSNFFFKKIQ